MKRNRQTALDLTMTQVLDVEKQLETERPHLFSITQYNAMSPAQRQRLADEEEFCRIVFLRCMYGERFPMPQKKVASY